VDRSHACKGAEEPGKQTITLMIEGKAKVFKWRHQVTDWNNGEQVEKLNRWRQQVFRLVISSLWKFWIYY
jgi:hypothetical protein